MLCDLKNTQRTQCLKFSIWKIGIRTDTFLSKHIDMKVKVS